MGNTNITWIGHASASVEFGEHVIYFDPWLDDNPVSTMKTSQVEKATAICVSHGHIDHIGDSFQLVRQTGAKLICSPEIGFYADSKGLKEGKEVYGLNTGGSWYQKALPLLWFPQITLLRLWEMVGSMDRFNLVPERLVLSWTLKTVPLFTSREIRAFALTWQL